MKDFIPGVPADASAVSPTVPGSHLSGVSRHLGIHFDPRAAAPPAESAAPPAATPPADPPAPPADGSAAPPPGAPPAESANVRQLREQYETLKTKLEPWEKLNADPKAVATHHQLVSKMRTEAVELGEQLGYDKAEIEEFFGQDPVAVLNHLRQKVASAEQTPLKPGDLKKQLDKMVEDRLKPITERENQRLDKEAVFRFDTEFDRLYKETFKDGLPDECREAIYEMAGQLMGDDVKAIERLKFQGQIADVKRYFQDAQTRFLKVVNSYLAHERKRTGGELPPPPGAPAAPKSRLDAKLSTGQTVKELFNF
jgi:hypothetical protein